MTKPSDELVSLVAQLKAKEITPEQFKFQSDKLIDSIGGREAEVDPVRLGRIDAAESMIRNL